MTRRLTLRTDRLVELAADELDLVAAAVNVGEPRQHVRLDWDLDEVGVHTARCALGCSCYCG